MNLVKNLFFTGVIASMCAWQTAQADAVSVGVGLHGAALEYHWYLSPRVSARFAVTDMPIDRKENDDDAEIRIKYDRTNAGMLFDFRPMAGSFHLTTGLYVGNHNIKLNANVKDDGEAYGVGDEDYYGSNLGIKTQASFAKAQPYFGLGWGTVPTKSGFFANFDFGVLYLGKASIKAKATGKACVGDCIGPGATGQWFDVANYADFQRDLEVERGDLEDDAKKIQFLPILQLAFGYKF